MKARNNRRFVTPHRDSCGVRAKDALALYQFSPAYAEGPGRYLRSGVNEDAAPLDPVFWKGSTGAHGELVARLSRENPIDGLLYDTEHYAGGMMYLQNSGFSTPTF